MFFGMIVTIVAVVLLVVYLVRLTASTGGGTHVAVSPPQAPSQTALPAAPPGEAARELLRRRYAAGEIERDEYLQKLADLST
jgi:putative membrane protein